MFSIFQKIFQSAFFIESLSITAYISIRGILCNGLCNVHAYSNCWKTHPMHLWIIFLRKELYATILDLFLTHAIFIVAKFQVLRLPVFCGSSWSSHPVMFLGKGILKICSKFSGEHPCRSTISIKLLSDLDNLYVHC